MNPVNRSPFIRVTADPSIHVTADLEEIILQQISQKKNPVQIVAELASRTFDKRNLNQLRKDVSKTYEEFKQKPSYEKTLKAYCFVKLASLKGKDLALAKWYEKVPAGLERSPEHQTLDEFIQKYCEYLSNRVNVLANILRSFRKINRSF